MKIYLEQELKKLKFSPDESIVSLLEYNADYMKTVQRKSSMYLWLHPAYRSFRKLQISDK